MKKILLFFAGLLFSVSAYSQQDNYFIQKVVETPLSKEAMWTNLKKWVSATFNNSKYVVDFEDKDAGLLTIKCKQSLDGLNTSVSYGVLQLSANTSITIDVKDEKYRYRIPYGTVTVKSGRQSSSELSRIPTSVINQQISDLEFVIKIGTVYYNGDTDWTIDDKFDSILAEYEKQRNETPQTDKKGKEAIKWTYANSKVLLLNDIKSGYMNVVKTIINSLEKGMIVNDDF